MKFKNHAERLQHPQAKIIPERIWENKFSLWVYKKFVYSGCSVNFTEEFVELVEIIEKNPSAEHLLRYLNTRLSRLEHLKVNVSFIVALSYPKLNLELLSQVNKLLDISDKLFFHVCAEIGNVELIKAYFEGSPVKEWIPEISKADPIYLCDYDSDPYSYHPFYRAASNGQLAVMKYLVEQFPEIKETMIAGGDYRAFREAAEYGYFDIVLFLAEASPPKLREMIRANNYYAFNWALRNGHLSIAQYLEKQALDELQEMVEAGGTSTFTTAASHGFLHVLRYLEEKAPDKIAQMISVYQYQAFRSAANYGYMEILHYLVEKAPNLVEEMIAAENYSAFRYAFYDHNFILLSFLIKFMQPSQVHELITANRYELFRVMDHKYFDNSLFNPQFLKDINNIIYFLLSDPDVFAYAEVHTIEYKRHTTGFINKSLQELESLRSLDTPNAITPEKAKHLFYLARALIRRKLSVEYLGLILSIPEVRALAHQEVSLGQPNELLRLAVTLDNQEACNCLLEIDAVRQAARRRNFYEAERRGVINLREISLDTESSMMVLSKEENDCLRRLQDYYSKKDRRNSDQILEELRMLLVKRYKDNPAKIKVYDWKRSKRNILLPFSWEEFTSLKLSKSEKKEALNAYYQNKDHTAWRFLANPNPWMHPNAPYAEKDSYGQWSCFERYAKLIAVLFLAVKDEEMIALDGYDSQSRLTQFIDELAHIERAHNWDEDGLSTFEKDNLEGDNPSCYSGTKRRLFQSVQGHPLLKELTLEILKQELNEFVWQHFQQVIMKENRDLLCIILQKKIDMEDLSSDEEIILSQTNISKEKQAEWINILGNKYGNRVEMHGDFLKKALDLSEQNSHFIQFSYLNFQSLLKNAIPQGDHSPSLDPMPEIFPSKTNTFMQFFKPEIIANKIKRFAKHHHINS